MLLVRVYTEVTCSQCGYTYHKEGSRKVSADLIEKIFEAHEPCPYAEDEESQEKHEAKSNCDKDCSTCSGEGRTHDPCGPCPDGTIVQ